MKDHIPRKNSKTELLLGCPRRDKLLPSSALQEKLPRLSSRTPSRVPGAIPQKGGGTEAGSAGYVHPGASASSTSVLQPPKNKKLQLSHKDQIRKLQEVATRTKQGSQRFIRTKYMEAKKVENPPIGLDRYRVSVSSPCALERSPQEMTSPAAVRAEKPHLD